MGPTSGAGGALEISQKTGAWVALRFAVPIAGPVGLHQGATRHQRGATLSL